MILKNARSNMGYAFSFTPVLWAYAGISRVDNLVFFRYSNGNHINLLGVPFYENTAEDSIVVIFGFFIAERKIQYVFTC